MGEGRTEGGDRAGIRRRLTVPEAAAEIGTTSEGVRSRIKRGTLETERESGRVWVILEGAPPRQGAAPPGPDAAPTGDRAELVEELRARVAFLEAEVERRGASEAELRRIIAALTSRMPEIEAPRETIPESPVSPQMAHSGGSQQQAEASADGVVVEGARQEGSVTSFLPTPRDKLSILSYAGIVLAATAFFWIGTWPPAFNNFPPANVLALAPILCGVWLGITRRGRPYWIYVLTAVVVGILMLSGVIVDAWRLEGRDFAAEQWSWAYIIPFHFLVPTLLFLSGTLFGDAIKRRALAKSLAETTTDRGTPIPDEGLSLGASAILAAVIAGAASIVAALVDGGP